MEFRSQTGVIKKGCQVSGRKRLKPKVLHQEKEILFVQLQGDGNHNPVSDLY